MAQTLTEHTMTLVNAIGTIDPEPRIAKGELSQQQVASFADALHGPAYYSRTVSFMLRGCVDGRVSADGTMRAGPNAAGGVFTLLVADMLTSQRFRSDAHDCADYAAHLFEQLNQWGYAHEYGDHRAKTISTPGASGCGAVDNLEYIIGFIARHGVALRQMAMQLGIAVSSDDHALITARAKQLTNGDIVFVSGTAMLAELTKKAGHASVDVLDGEHNEVAVVVNMQPGTTLNRKRIAADYGGGLQAFNYDRWAAEQSVKVISQGADVDEARQKLLAADYFNLAVACVLAGPGLRVVLRVPHGADITPLI